MITRPLGRDPSTDGRTHGVPRHWASTGEARVARTEDAKLAASDGATNDFFGRSISLSGERLLIGARSDDTAGGIRAGSAYLFERDATGVWTEAGKLTASDGAAGDEFGAAVALAGERAIVGAEFADTDGGTDTGAAYLFERDATGAWTEAAKLVAADGAAIDFFGFSVALADERAIVGAIFADTDGGTDTGAAYLFERDATGAWVAAGKLTASDGATGDIFGAAVALADERAIVGASETDTAAGESTGAAHLFERDATGVWVETARLTAADEAAGDSFGTAVALAGERVIVGAPGADTDGGTDTGAVYLFERDATGAWIAAGKLTASDGASGDRFGHSVALAGGWALVGANRVTTAGGALAGAAYLFERDASGAWVETARLDASDGTPFARFGHSVALADERAIVGAGRAGTAGGPDTGAVYVFELARQTTKRLKGKGGSICMKRTVIDISVLRNLNAMIGGDSENLRRLVEDFVTHIPRQIESMRRAQAASDWAAVLRAVHSTKSNARAMGALELAEVCAELERHCREVRPVDLENRLTVVSARADEAIDALEQIDLGDV